jgi:glycosyltransferase involved in cell wall biosynthesis
VGRLVPYKGADILLEAAAPLLRKERLYIDIVGDGPEMEHLRTMTKDLGISGSVELPGWIEHTALQDRLRRSDVFAFPSVREFGGGVVLEAMSLGIVPVVADYAGPSELVTDDTGYRIPMGDREALVAGFRKRLEALVIDPTGIRAMGRRARERVFELFSWEAKAAQTRRVYQWVLGDADKPDFGLPLSKPVS